MQLEWVMLIVMNIIASIVDLLDSFPLLTLLIPLIPVALGWYLNEQSKRKYEDYKRKEERYSQLIRSFKGFYTPPSNAVQPATELRNEFIMQLNLCWMYCPDEVIRSAYGFLSTVQVDTKEKDATKEKEIAAGELMLAIRNDLINRKPLKHTKLTAKDFKHLKST